MKLLATHAFNCIVLMIKFGRTSCEDIPPALLNIMIMYIKLYKLSWIRNYQNPQKFNEQTYSIEQIVTDNTIKHRHTL